MLVAAVNPSLVGTAWHVDGEQKQCFLKRSVRRQNACAVAQIVPYFCGLLVRPQYPFVHEAQLAALDLVALRHAPLVSIGRPVER